jgi:hypothetical protein
VSDPRRTAQLLMRAFPGWRCWLGGSTGTWWALPPLGHRLRSLIEAKSPEQLATRIREIQLRADEIHEIPSAQAQ